MIIDEGKLWSLIRNVLQQGAAIHIDHESLGYEMYSARLDAAASDRVAEFVKLAAAPQPPVVFAPARYKGSDHIVPLADCPMCGDETDFVDVDGAWHAECSGCGLSLCDYSSRLDLCADWNRRAPQPPVVEVTDEVARLVDRVWFDLRNLHQDPDVASGYDMIAAVQQVLGPQLGLVTPFQPRVQPWMAECFGNEITSDKLERNDRFIEESLELVQATGYSAERAHALVDYVFSRHIGEPSQEVGGVMVTLAALCLANGLNMHAAAETELARVWTKIEAIREKQKSKPRGSTLPVPTTQLGLVTRYQSASSATGGRSASSATGYQSASINTGNCGSAEVLDGERSSFGVAVATGFAGRAKAAIGSAIVLVHRDDDGAILHIRAAIAGKDVKADTWYSLDATGEFYEVTP